ncbi:hypothetical protein D3227_32110 [Mesorhizobium waimense]|uniref:Uncharacterized protein n=1 Tax=Mesorhizobium waimense TaxID=1300307 RepID=A0A3A5K4V0_9HYPH|nr:hypothetical protein D3227_32110 [Mesorhizobium waimense]
MNVFGKQIVSGAFWAAAETWVRQVAMFGAFVALARQPQKLGSGALRLAALATGRILRLAVDGKRER